MPSACSSRPATGRFERSIGLMLSSPRKPPPNRLVPSGSIRLTHHVKFSSSFGSSRAKNLRSVRPSMAHTCSAAQACTGGLTSPKFHSYAGIAPFGCWNHSRHIASNWYFANAGSMCASGIVWKARSHAANHGYSQGSGIDRMSSASRCVQPMLRPPRRCSGAGGWVGSPASQRLTS